MRHLIKSKEGQLKTMTQKFLSPNATQGQIDIANLENATSLLGESKHGAKDNKSSRSQSTQRKLKLKTRKPKCKGVSSKNQCKT